MALITERVVLNYSIRSSSRIFRVRSWCDTENITTRANICQHTNGAFVRTTRHTPGAVQSHRAVAALVAELQSEPPSARKIIRLHDEDGRGGSAAGMFRARFAFGSAMGSGAGHGPGGMQEDCEAPARTHRRGTPPARVLRSLSTSSVLRTTTPFIPNLHSKQHGVWWLLLTLWQPPPLTILSMDSLAPPTLHNGAKGSGQAGRMAVRRCTHTCREMIEVCCGQSETFN